MLYNIVYGSTASKQFSDDELLEMLRHWRAANVRLGITGLLLYREGAFIQSLEGDETTVRALYAAIQADPRHFQVFTILTVAIPKRRFPDWSMGFQNLHGIDPADVPGYNPQPDLDLPAGGDAPVGKALVALRLLTAFARED